MMIRQHNAPLFFSKFTPLLNRTLGVLLSSMSWFQLGLKTTKKGKSEVQQRLSDRDQLQLASFQQSMGH